MLSLIAPIRDAPNAWPPHQYIAIQALRALPSNLTKNALPTLLSNQSTFDLIPDGQLGLVESQLPAQTILGSNQNVTTSGPGSDLNKLNGTVVNGGNATDGEGWAQALQRQMANRYMTSALCSWCVFLVPIMVNTGRQHLNYLFARHATGGSIDGILPRLSDAELNVTLSIGNTGNVCPCLRSPPHN